MARAMRREWLAGERPARGRWSARDDEALRHCQALGMFVAPDLPQVPDMAAPAPPGGGETR